MKNFLLILALAIGTISCQQAQFYLPVNSSEIQNNTIIQYLANFGAQSVAQEAIKARDLPNGLYNITRIYSVSQQQLVNGINYDFDVEVANAAGNSSRLTYVINYQPANNDEEVVSFTYERAPGLNNVIFGNQDSSDEVDYSDNLALLASDVLISEEDAELEWLGEAWIVGEDDSITEDNLSGYSPVDLASFNNDQEAQELLAFGLEDVINQIVDRGDLDNDYPFEITQIYSVEEQAGNNGNYQYDVGIDNRNGTTGRLVFLVLSETQTSPRIVSSYRYNINTVTTNNQPITLGSNSESAPVDDALDGDIDDDDSDAGGYTQVDSAQATNDARIQSAQNTGAQYVAQQGIATGVLPAGQYQVNRVFSVYEQVVNGLNYRFDVELSNGQGRLVRTQYIVYSQSTTNTERVTSYKFTT